MRGHVRFVLKLMRHPFKTNPDIDITCLSSTDWIVLKTYADCLGKIA